MASVDDLRSALEQRGHRIKKSAGRFVTTCPAHDDKEPSLSFGEGDRTELVATCHAGCTFEAILEALGLTHDGVTQGRVDDFERRIEATYDYVDEDGDLLFQAVRLRDPKSFRQRRIENGAWSWKLGDARRVLYRLPAVREAAALGRAVFGVEGEKDVEALERLGFVATCSPMGAGKWRDDYADSLLGVPWFFSIGDCDDVGREHAKTAVESAHARGIPSKLLDLAPGRDDGYDVSDFVAEHGDQARAELERIVRTTKRWPQSQGPTLPIVSVTEFMSGIPNYDESKDYLGPFLHGGHRVHVAGPIGHGKTSFIAEAMSAALRGTDFLGWKGKGGDLRGLLIDLEMPEELLGQAIRDARLHELGDRFQVLHLPDGLEIDTNPRHREMIEHAVERFDIVAFDPWYKLLGNELEWSSGRSVIAVFDGIRARRPDLCVVVGFHAQEPLIPNQPITLGQIMGFKFFQRPADVIVTFQRLKGNTSRLRWEKNRSARLDVAKGEQWTLEWTRGQGFRREEPQSANERVLAVFGTEWIGSETIEEETGLSRNRVSAIVSALTANGLLESQTVNARGKKLWRLPMANQERLDVA